MTNVSFPKEISSLFDDDHNNFPAIIGKSSDDYLQCLCHSNFTALQDIDLGEIINATGLILSKDDHKSANGNQVFDQSNRALEAYNPSIQDDNNNAIHLLQDKTWYRKLYPQADIQTAERVGKKFVLSCMKETWVVRLKNETTLFKHVTLQDLFDHLGEMSMGR